MREHPRVVLWPLLLATLALLAVVGPATAHTPAAPLASSGALAVADSIVPVLNAAPAPPALSPPAFSAPVLQWYLPLALALGAVAVWWRPRRALVVALVLLLGVFAFENALHSVHHGLGAKQSGECTIAAAAAHLAAVTDDVAVAPSVILAAAGPPPESPVAEPPLRLIGPSQGRAPPAPAA
jgi:hypothetical protein